MGEVSERYEICDTQLFTWRREARRRVEAQVAFSPVVLDDEAADDEGLVEVELGAARVRIGRTAEVGMALAGIGALRGRR